MNTSTASRATANAILRVPTSVRPVPSPARTIGVRTIVHGGEHVAGAEVDRIVVTPPAEGRHDGFTAGHRSGDRLRVEYVAHHHVDTRRSVSVRGPVDDPVTPAGAGLNRSRTPSTGP